jgi:hypothetical protein
VTEVDIKLAAYRDALAICEETAASYGDMPRVGIRAIIAALRDRIRELTEDETEVAA